MTATYDPKLVIVNFRGHTIQGYSDSTHIEVDRDEDAMSAKAGNDGEVVRSVNNNKMGTITVRLLQSSASNQILSAMAAEDELFGTAIGPAQVQDMRGTTLEFAAESWIRKVPKSDFAKEAGEREWVFGCANLKRNVGSGF